MKVRQHTLGTASGDSVLVTLFSDEPNPPRVCVTIDDASGSPLPTVELTLAELGRLRDILRRLGREASDGAR